MQIIANSFYQKLKEELQQKEEPKKTFLQKMFK